MLFNRNDDKPYVDQVDEFVTDMAAPSQKPLRTKYDRKDRASRAIISGLAPSCLRAKETEALVKIEHMNCSYILKGTMR